MTPTPDTTALWLFIVGAALLIGASWVAFAFFIVWLVRRYCELVKGQRDEEKSNRDKPPIMRH